MAYSNTKAFKRDLNAGLPKLDTINRGVLIKIQSGGNILGESPKQVPRGGTLCLRLYCYLFCFYSRGFCGI